MLMHTQNTHTQKKISFVSAMLQSSLRELNFLITHIYSGLKEGFSVRKAKTTQGGKSRQKRGEAMNKKNR